MKTHLIDLTYTAPREQYTFQSEGRLWRWLGTLLVVMGCTLSVAQAQVSGKVFQDFNANGAQGTASPNLEPGYGGITVKAYDASGTQVATATTAADGTYTLTGVTGAVRVEFTGFPSYYYSGPKGTQNNTSVQFVTAPATNVNFGINYPVNYCQSNPNLATPCYVNGAASGTGDVLVSWPYSNSGLSGPVNHLATQTQIGSTYGLAYDRIGHLLYSGSHLKRHVGLPDLNGNGKGDLGNIFVTNTTTNTTSLWLDLTTLGIDFGSIANDAGRGLGTSLTSASNDPTAYPLVGKAGIGDIDLSDDGTTLYLTNLYDRKLYAIDMVTKTVKGSWIVPQTCSNNDVVNFGLKYYLGNVYVGQVCTAATSQSASDLKATVYKFDGSAFTNVLDIPLNYARKYGYVGCINILATWHPWLDNVPPTSNACGGDFFIYGQPILSDIEFEPLTGNMIIGLRDRLGDQLGKANYLPTGTSLNTVAQVGDILGATMNSNGTYTLESNATLGGETSAGANNNQGPGGGEFYFDDYMAQDHTEQAMGALALLPGTASIVSTFTNPQRTVVIDNNNSFESGGVRFLDNTDGEFIKGFTLYRTRSEAGTFSKANGLGDLEVLCDPAPVEIGNRVWKDIDNDGIQDPDEPALAGVTVQLTDASGTLIATTITDANGNYLFSSATSTNTNSAQYGLNLQPNTNYNLKISSLGTDASVTGLMLTGITSALGETAGSNNTGSTLNNNDAFVVGGIPTIKLTTGPTGANNHTYDFGFTSSRFDLALRKKLASGQAASVNPGDKVTFTVKVYNQGSVAATNIQVSDYIPTGLVFNAADNASWTSVSTTLATTTIAGSLAAGDSASVNIVLQVGANFTGTAVNATEISAATGGTDVDSTPDNTPSNDGTPKNDVINEDGQNGGDEDDHDIEPITVTPAPVFDLALRKTLAAGQSTTINPGSSVKFTVTIFNQGNVDATAIQVSDYIPTGLTLNDANWSVSGGIATLNTSIGSLAAGASTTRDIIFTVNAGFTGSATNTAEISSASGGTDVDSTPDNNPNNDGTPKNDVINEDGKNGGDEDDSDAEIITVGCVKPILTAGNIVCSGNTYSVSFYSSIPGVTASAGTIGNGIVTGIPVGTNVIIRAAQSFSCISTLTVQGVATCPTTCTLPNLTVGQPLCEGTTYSVSFTASAGATVTSNAGTMGNNVITGIPIGTNITITATGTSSSCVSRVNVSSPTNCSIPCENPSITLSGPLCSSTGTSYSLNYILSSGASVTASAGTVSGSSITNIPVGTDVTLTVTANGCADKMVTVKAPTNCPMFDLALKKSVATGQATSVTPGSTVKYTITIYNQGNVNATAIQVTDYIPTGLTLNDANWTVSNGMATLNTPIASLAAGSSTTRDITFTVNAGFSGAVSNGAEISSARDANGNTPTDIDSTPDQNPNNDGTPKNDVINEDGKNGGDEDDSDAEIINVTMCPTTAYQLCSSKPSYTLSAPATYTSIKWYKNGVVIAGATAADYVATQVGNYTFAGLNPSTGCRDSICCPIIVTGCFDLALKKTLAAGQSTTINPGSTVKFTVTVYNQGFIDATAIQVTDYIPTGLTLNDANWSVSGGMATLNTPIASLAAGASTTRDITFTVNAGVTGSLTNTAEISSATGGTDVDSSPDNNPNNDGTPKNDVINEDGQNGNDQDDSDPEVINILCIKPILTTGNIVCSGTTYSVVYYSSVSNVTASAGTVSNGMITGIPVGTNVTITATQSAGCVSVETVTAPVSCPTSCVIPQLTVGQPICNGSTYSVSYTATSGATLTTSAGTVGTNVITGIPVGTDVTLTAMTDAANGCVSRVTVKTPISCVDVCENPGVSISGPLCSSSTTYSINYSLMSGATLTSSAGVVSNGSVSGVPMGTSVTLTVNVPNCTAKTVVVASPSVCPIFDLALRKTLAAGQSASVAPGSTVKFTVTIFNQGNVNATAIQVSDYIPTGLTLNDANWSVSGGMATLNTPIASLAAGASTTRDITFTVNAGVTGSLTNTAEISSATGGTDVDSSPDNNPNNDGTPKNDVINEDGQNGNDQDDSDPEVINILCIKPILTTGNIVCSGTTYSVVYYSSVSNVTPSAGTVSNGMITGIPVGTNVTITATQSAGCVTSLSIEGPASCQTNPNCTLPMLIVGQPACEGNNTYSVSFYANRGTVTVSAGTISGNSVINIPISQDLTIRATDGTCVSTNIVPKPVNCSDPCENPSLSVSGPVCDGSSSYHLNYVLSPGATLMSSHGTVSNGQVIGLPTGTNVTLTVKKTGCADKIIVFPAVYCSTEKVDLALKKLINKKQAKVGDEVEYTLKVWNESSTPATGVEVNDTLSAGVEYVSSSATRGSYNPTTHQWVIGNVGANGDTVTLRIRVKVLLGGIWFNKAEISKTNEPDEDSTPGNGTEGEDDIDRVCFTVPMQLCVGEKVQASVPAQYTNVKWFKNGGTTPISTGNTVLLSEVGTYTYTSTSNTCPAEGCCPIIIEAGTNCCPVDICIPFTINKKRK